MLTEIEFTFGTGDFDLDPGSQVLVSLIVRGVTVLSFDAASGDAWRTGWTIGPIRRTLPAPFFISDVQSIEITFMSAPTTGGLGDRWSMRSLLVRGNDDVSGWVNLYTNEDIGALFLGGGSWTADIATYSPTGETLVEVRDETGAAVPGAELFIDSVYSGKTDSNGQKLIPSTFSEVVVRQRIHEQRHYKSHHSFRSSQNWNYRVYYTNVAISDNGMVTVEGVRSGSRLLVIVRRRNTLIGVNLVASVEWTMSMSDVAEQQAKLRKFSEFLYNATDGQFFVEAVEIHDQRRLWSACDIHVLADYAYRANAQGGLLSADLWRNSMILSRGNPGRTYAHEFGHFGFGLGDEYQDETTVMCTRSLPNSAFAFRSGRSLASCMMWNQCCAPKICSTHRLNPHVTTTRQGAEACWDTIKRLYNTDVRWSVRAPTDRRSIPGTIRRRNDKRFISEFMMPIFLWEPPAREGIFIGGKSLTILDSSGAPVMNLLVRTRGPAGYWMAQGSTDALGRLTLVGLYAGDSLLVQGPGSASVGFVRRIPMTPGPLSITI